MPNEMENLAATFRQAAETGFPTTCPLYAVLARTVAEDQDLLELASHARAGQLPPLILLDSVHYLLLQNPQDPLSQYYSSLTKDPQGAEGASAAFRDFCRRHRQELEQLLPARLVQTNEVRRCAQLLPAYVCAARELEERPLAIVGLGVSAGLLLLFDKYGYDYGQGRRCGSQQSPLQLHCELRGSIVPPLPARMPAVASRIGIDLNPLDVRNDEHVEWLLACIWPNSTYQVRAERVRVAVEVERQDPPQLIAGDIIKQTPRIVAQIPPDQGACIVHSYTTYEMPPDKRQALDDAVETCGRTRPIAVIGLELDDHFQGRLELVMRRPGAAPESRRLAQCHVHGEWLEWLDTSHQA